jgi:hypothetical protein
MQEIGYFAPDINWSVRKRDGRWCSFCRLPEDEPATTSEQLEAIEGWKRSHEEMYDRAAGISGWR